MYNFKWKGWKFYLMRGLMESVDYRNDDLLNGSGMWWVAYLRFIFRCKNLPFLSKFKYVYGGMKQSLATRGTKALIYPMGHGWPIMGIVLNWSQNDPNKVIGEQFRSSPRMVLKGKNNPMGELVEVKLYSF